MINYLVENVSPINLVGYAQTTSVLWLEEEAEITALAQISIKHLCKKRILQDLDIILKFKYQYAQRTCTRVEVASSALTDKDSTCTFTLKIGYAKVTSYNYILPT